MVNGWCLGGAFTPLIACDLAIAAEDARFGLSEINWGIIPAGNVSKAVSEVLGARAALYYIMTGETFDGRKAVSLGLVNEGRLRVRPAFPHDSACRHSRWQESLHSSWARQKCRSGTFRTSIGRLRTTTCGPSRRKGVRSIPNTGESKA